MRTMDLGRKKARKRAHLMATKFPEAACVSVPPALDESDELNGPLDCWFMRNRHVRLACVKLPRRDATVVRGRRLKRDSTDSAQAPAGFTAPNLRRRAHN
ncbi:hypothetical protein MRX96_042484 [Rhipicephalus microplus]